MSIMHDQEIDMNVEVVEGPIFAELTREIQRRRTFAIISHPDAGKTTLTEKFLLYAGCIDIAGAVRGRKSQRAVTSDWMELERERGISISSTVLSFSYRDHLINLLDTPGHQDFSEDTYRTLAAADSAVMVIDAAKGIETQTKKLFQVCAARRIPIFTFVNKMDRLGRDPLDLLGEIEQVLGIEAVPWNWPIGLGQEFCGLVERQKRRAVLFEAARQGDLKIATREIPLAEINGSVATAIVKRLHDDLELLDGASGTFNQDAFLRGRMTPVYFGSAMTNYGLEAFLESFVAIAPPPEARRSDSGPVPTARPDFAGFVFKIQANLNPKHRDRVAFVRVCAGKFTPESEPVITRRGERLRIKGSHRLFARDREALQSAYPGDIIGLAIGDGLRLGDTLCVGAPVRYEGLPQFSPECFASIRCLNTARRKQMADGLQQLADEGAVQLFTDPANQRDPVLAALGELQFDVVRFRLETEYGATSEVTVLPFHSASWVHGNETDLKSLIVPHGMRLVLDHRRRPAILSQDSWDIGILRRLNPAFGFRLFSEELFIPSE